MTSFFQFGGGCCRFFELRLCDGGDESAAALVFVIRTRCRSSRSLFGKPTEETWPGFTKLPHYPDFLPNFVARRMSAIIPLPEGSPFRDEALDLMRTSA